MHRIATHCGEASSPTVELYLVTRLYTYVCTHVPVYRMIHWYELALLCFASSLATRSWLAGLFTRVLLTAVCFRLAHTA